MQENLNSIKENLVVQLKERVRGFGFDFSSPNEYNLRRKVEAAFRSILRENKVSISRSLQDEILTDVIGHFFGLGPIDSLLKDPNIYEIMINGPKQVYIEKDGNLELTEATFQDEEQLMYFIDMILAPLGRRATELEPYIDARLKDGSRVNIIIPPVSLIGPVLTIRRFSNRVLKMGDLINLGSLDRTAAEFLHACVVSRRNILISGSASSGKTTLLNVLANFISENERVITIEDTRELRIDRSHVIPLETRPPNIEGKGEITIRNLLKNSLHMRADRIIVGEVRSDEVLDMVQAMNTGHEGSMTTLHANSPFDAINRLEVLALMGSPNISSDVAKRQIITAIDLIIHMSRFADGSRKVSKISELVKGRDYAIEDIFALEDMGDKHAKLQYTGRPPTFYAKLQEKADYICKEFELKQIN